MIWELKVLEDNTNIRSFKFCSNEDAKHFLSFAEIYMDETGCGNGYDAYWPAHNLVSNSHPSLCLPFFNKKKNQMNVDFVRAMLYSILQVRFSKNDPDIDGFNWHLEQTRQGISFWIDDLPPASRPQVGDMYRIPRSRFGSAFPGDLGCIEGRIIEDLGNSFMVLPSHLESRFSIDKRIKLVYYEIEACLVIKINDWGKYLAGQ